MKGKVAFVFGAAVGYVLGTRAGRERYAQIKRSAQTIWETAPVQRGVEIVREAAQVRVDTAKSAAVRAGKGAFNALLQGGGAAKQAGKKRDTAKPGAAKSGSAKSGDAKLGDAKPSSSKSGSATQAKWTPSAPQQAESEAGGA